MVDDDPEVTAMLLAILEGKGFHAWALNDPRETVSRAAQFAPDLILLDFDMRQLLGSDVAMLLGREHRTREIPILFLSGFTDPDHRSIAHLSGAVDYLEKPVDPGSLVAKIREILGMG